MARATQNKRRYIVHARHVDKHYGWVVQEHSFEAAALSYIEHFSPVITLEDEPPEISVIVRDLGSGHEHCFTINLDLGAATSCE